MSIAQRDALKFHVLFAIVAAPLLIFSTPPLQGWLLLLLALAYNIAIPAIGLRRGHSDWVDLWAFLLPLSVMQIFPDWALAQLFEVLVFPDLGLPRAGPVPVCFALMWIILLWPIVYFSDGKVWRAALLGLALFCFAEWAARLLNVWYSQGVRVQWGIPLYVLPGETLLGVGALIFYHVTRWRSLLSRVAAAAMLSTFYTGACVLAYLLMERT